MPLHLPAPLAHALWSHARREAPRECVGALGGVQDGPDVVVRALYPLPNIARSPEREYLADPGAFLRALRAMEREGLELVALYHSHPRGPAVPSESDRALAQYAVPYLIADLAGGGLRGFALPGGGEVRLVVGEGSHGGPHPPSPSAPPGRGE